MNAITSSDSFFKLNRLGRLAYEQNRHETALAAYRHGSELAADLGSEHWRVRFRALEGHVCRMMAEFERAIPALLEVTQNISNDIDTNDVIVALNDLVSICLETRSLAYTHKLIEQFDCYLGKVRKEACSHFLFYLRGLMATRRGEFVPAYEQFHRAWETMNRNRWTPHYSEAVHLVELCDTAFMLRDGQKLARWVTAIERAASAPDLESDSIRAAHGRLLLMRLARTDGNDFASASQIANEALTKLDGFDGRLLYLPFEIGCLRALMLSGNWQALDQQLRHHPLPDTFWPKLFKVDHLIAKLFRELGVRVPDFEIEDPRPIQLSPKELNSTLSWIIEGIWGTIPELESLAQREDARLEVNRYSQLVAKRKEILLATLL